MQVMSIDRQHDLRNRQTGNGGCLFGDTSYIILENRTCSYYTPQQGTNTWYDAMVITKGTAVKQIWLMSSSNFMLDDENALSNTEEVGYTSTVKKCIRGDENELMKFLPIFTDRQSKNEIFGYQKPKIKQKFTWKSFGQGKQK